MKRVLSRLLTSVVTLLSLIIVLTSALVGCEESVPAIDVTPSVVSGNGGSTGGGENNTGGDTEEKPYLTVTPQLLTFEAQDNSFETIKVNSNSTYRVSTNASWIKLSPSGSDWVVSVSVNDKETMREDSVIVASSTLRQSVVVQQMGKAIEYTLSVDKKTISIGSPAHTDSVQIVGNDVWTATPSDGWITLSTAAGVGDQKVYVSLTANESTGTRNGHIKVKGEKSGTELTVNVSQSGTDYHFTVDHNTLEVDSHVGTTSFTLSTNDRWTAQCSDTWLTLSQNEGSGDRLFTVNVAENTTSSARTGKIELKGVNSGSSLSVSVTQSGKYLTISPESLSFSSAGGTESVTLDTDGEVSYSESANWLSCTQNGNMLKVTASANTDTGSRTGSITISLKGLTSGSISRVVNVTQSGESYTLSVNKSSISVSSGSTSESFTIMSNDTWTASSSVSWASLSSTSGSGNKTITVSISANNNPTERTGTITVKGTNSQTVTISLNQSGEGYTLSVNKSSISVSSGSTSESFTITSNDTWTASSNVSWATLSSTSGSGNKTITVSISENTGTSERTGKITIRGNNSGSKTISLSQSGKQNSGGGNGYDNGHEYVDLGLPSGLLWATCNVGANSPEDYGDYFAWGETEPKSNYNWSTYFDTTDGGNTFKKYYNNGGKTVLDPADDAAHANWGGSWRMPTRAEQDELRNKCTWEWTTQNGVNGRKVTGPNGNSLFLPAAGYRNNSSLNGAGSYGYYWSSSLSTSDSSGAYGLDFGSGDVDWGSYSRYYGLSVRPVR